MTTERNLISLEGITIKCEIPIPRTREGFETKSYIFFDLNEQEMSLFTRKIETFCLPTLIGFDTKGLEFSDIYKFAWKTLKEGKLPVVDNTWKMSLDKVATTNLIANGGSVYDQKIDAIIERDTLPMDGEFVKIPIDEVGKKAGKLLDLANRMGVELMSDGPFHIKVNPDGSFSLIVLDIGKVRIHANPKNLPRDAKKDNGYYINKALRDFASIQGNIKTLRDARGLA